MSNRRKLTSQDYRTLALSALGGALEFYDFIIYIFFSQFIQILFFPPEIPQWLSEVQTLGIFAAGYLARPFGGTIMAHFGDKIGRKKMFAFSILLMAIPTLIIGLLPTYAHIGIWAPLLLLLMRICQGAAVGGEIPGAWVFVAEHVPHKKIGLACGILTAGLVLGILIGSIISTFINKNFSNDEIIAYAWRIAFIIGGVFGLISLYLRRWLKETPIFTEIEKRKKRDKGLPVKTVIKEYKRSVFCSMILTWIISAGIMVVILLAPNYLIKEYQISPLVAQQANRIAIICLIIGCTISGWAADKIGFPKTLLFGSIFCIINIWIFYANLPMKNETYLFISYGLVGLGIGIIGSFAFYMVQSFPAEIRYSGVSFSFNIAYAIAGGFTPLLITSLTYVNIMAPAYYVIALFLISIILSLYLFKNNIRYSIND